MKKRATYWVLAVAVIALLIGAYELMNIRPQTSTKSNSPNNSATPSAQTSTPAATPTLTCSAANLNLSINGPQGAAGTFYYTLSFTNKGNSACTLYGYPGVQLLSNATALGNPAGRSPAVTAKVVTLQPGQVANANLGVPNSDNYPSGTCSATSTTLSVYPPDSYTTLTIPFTQRYCPGFSISTVYTP